MGPGAVLLRPATGRWKGIVPNLSATAVTIARSANPNAWGSPPIPAGAGLAHASATIASVPASARGRR